jgi:ABC-type glycerol-3-phosphate transport system permease component
VEKKYLIILTILAAVTAAYGILSMQVLVAAGLLVLLVLLVLAFYLQVRGEPQYSGLRDDGLSAIIAGALVAGVFAMMHLEVLLWAVALAALFLIEQSLERIEKRLEKP